jgi:hypothetical protein
MSRNFYVIQWNIVKILFKSVEKELPSDRDPSVWF